MFTTELLFSREHRHLGTHMFSITYPTTKLPLHPTIPRKAHGHERQLGLTVPCFAYSLAYVHITRFLHIRACMVIIQISWNILMLVVL